MVTDAEILESETKTGAEIAERSFAVDTKPETHWDRGSPLTLNPISNSLTEAESIVLSMGGSNAMLCLPQPGDNYARRGQLIGETPMHWVQQVSHLIYVAHSKSDLPTSMKLLGVYEIQYPSRSRTVVQVLSRVTGALASRHLGRTTNPKRSPRALAFEHAPRMNALCQFPELGGAYALVDAAEAHAATQFPLDERAQDLVVKAALAAMILNLSKDRLPDDQAVARAVQQRAKSKPPRSV